MNESITLGLNGLFGKSLFVDGLVIFGSEILPYILIVLLCVWVYYSKEHKKRIRQFVMILFAALLTAAIADILKFWINAPRPFEVIEGVNAFVDHDPYGSFPSLHMAFFTALAAAAFRRDMILSGMLFAGAFIIGFSRIAAGVHFPVDIIAGFSLGIAVAIIMWFLEERYRDMYSLKRRILFWRR